VRSLTVPTTIRLMQHLPHFVPSRGMSPNDISYGIGAPGRQASKAAPQSVIVMSRRFHVPDWIVCAQTPQLFRFRQNDFAAP
jgi:hypothetical protein